MFDALLSLPALYLFSTGYTSWSTSLNILFFYMTWSTLLLSHPPLRVELLGSLAVRILFFWMPTLLFALADVSVPSLSQSLKLQGARGLGRDRGRTKATNRLKTAGWGLANMAVTTGVIQASVELLLVSVLGWRSALRVSSRLPMPGEVVWDVFRAFLVREVLIYYVHRYGMHEARGLLPNLHKQWQHSTTAPWSAIAHYDHPLPYLLLRFLPVYLPAVMFRFHLLTWFLFLALVSIEEVTAHSGYRHIYSLLGGATKRTDIHFMCKGKGNYSPWGIMDWIHGTSVGSNVKDDVKDEYAVHEIRRDKRRSMPMKRVS